MCRSALPMSEDEQALLCNVALHPAGRANKETSVKEVFLLACEQEDLNSQK